MGRILPFVLLPLSLLPQTAPAQEARLEEAKTAMARLDFMVGRWEGTSTMRMGSGPPEGGVGSEVVEWRLGGLALLVEGEFFAPDAPEGSPPIHQALGIITYDPASGAYRFDAHTAEGRSVTAEAVLDGDVFEWRIPETPRGKIRYRLTLDEQGRWYEVGEGSRDGEIWYPFFEMTLTKIEPNGAGGDE